ncbi:MAG: lysophospholipid acyltransferase family protein [Cruoricaptor ignavus]|nr:lysophospholipid acyltransferase family protein [Cruoricaptor ignavus]
MKIVLAIIISFSKLPMKVLYLLSDVIFVLNYYFIGYRTKVVSENIKNSFPEKTDEERKKIEKKFFRNFFDYIVETLKSLTVSDTELRVRMQHINQHLFQEAKDEGKNIIFLTGHVFNWEWMTVLAKIIPQEHCHPVYRKANNEFWNQQIIKIRNRFGNQSLEAGDVLKHIFRNQNDGNSAYMFVADQSPAEAHINTGTMFLNQKTPVFIGYDKLATRMDLAFIYCEMKKVKRGFYQVNYYRIYSDDEKFKEFELVSKFHQLLENTIKKQPDNYLWTHRRWKYADSVKQMF